VDVTDSGAEEDDEVVLLCRQGEEEITSDEIAAAAETIAYEVVARLSPRLTRRLVE
jgi:alanine racemase